MALGGPTLGSVWVDIGGDASGFHDTFTNTLAGAEKQAKSGLSRINDQIVGFGKVVNKTLAAGFAAAGAAAMAGLGLSIRAGLQRLVGIEEARAKLKGLGHDVQTIDTIMDNALQSVLGTAYRLDDAATVAAEAVAAGIKPGEELERALKLVGDTAQIAGTDFLYMGSRFARVAAQGRMTGDDLRVLGQQGLPVLQWIQEEYGVTAEAARKMVSDSQISFEDFANIIEKNIGGAALESGNTTMGAFRNMGAAAGRLGETLAGPVFRQARVFFNAMKDWIDGLNRAIKPMMETFENWLGPAFQSALSAADSFLRGLQGLAGELDPITGLVLNTGDAAHHFGFRVHQGFKMVSDAVSSVVGWFREYREVWQPLAATLGKAVVLIAGFASVWAAAAGVIGVLTAAAPIAALVGLVAAMVRAYETSEVFQARVRQVFDTLRDVVGPTVEAIQEAVASFSRSMENGAGALTAFQHGFEVFMGAMSVDGGVFDTLRGLFDDVVTWLVDGGGIQMLLDAFVTAKLRFLDVAIEVFSVLVDAVVTVLPKVVEALTAIIPKVVEALLVGLPVLLRAGIEMFMALVDAAVEAIPLVVAAIVELVPVLVNALVTAIPLLLDGAIQLFEALADAVPTVLPDVIDALVTAFPLIVTAITQAFPLLLDAALQLFVALVVAVAEVLPDIIIAITDAIPDIVEALLDAMPLLLDAAVELFTAIVEALPIVIPELITTLVELFPQVWDALIELAPHLLMAAIEVFAVIIQAVWDTIPGLYAVVMEMGFLLAEWFSELPGKLWEAIKHFGSMLWEWAKDAMQEAWEGFKAIFGNSPGPLLNWFGEIPGKLVAAVARLPGMLLRWARDAMQQAWTAFRERFDRILAWFRGLPGRVITAVTDLIGRMGRWAREAIANAHSSFTERWEAVIGWFRGLPDAVIAAVVALIAQMVTWGMDVIAGAHGAITDRWEAVQTWFRELPGRIRDAIPNPLEILKGVGASIMQGLADGISGAVGRVTGAVGDVLGAARNLLPFSPAKEGPFSGRGWTYFAGEALVRGLAEGIVAFARVPVDALNALMWEVHNALGPIRTVQETLRDLAFAAAREASTYEDAMAALAQATDVHTVKMAAALELPVERLWELVDAAEQARLRATEEMFRLQGEWERRMADIAQAGMNLRASYVESLTVIVERLGWFRAQMVASRGMAADELRVYAGMVENFARSVTSSFNQFTSVVGNFRSATGDLTGEDVLGWLENQVAAAQSWSVRLQELAAAGIDEGLLQEIAEAGPAASVLIDALLEAVADGGVGAINEAREQLDAILDTTIARVGRRLSPAWEEGAKVGESIAEGIAQGIADNTWAIEKEVRDLVRGLVEIARDELGIASPSRVFSTVGRMVGSGLMQGMASTRDAVMATMRDLVDLLPASEWQAWRRAGETLGSAFATGLEPHLGVTAPVPVRTMQPRLVPQPAGVGAATVVDGRAATDDEMLYETRQVRRLLEQMVRERLLVTDEDIGRVAEQWLVGR